MNNTMKKLTILLTLALFSCEKEPVKNCACNKITETDITHVGVYESYYGEVTTVNECSGYTTTETVEGTGHDSPEVGECF